MEGKVDDKLKYVEEKLEEFERRVGLPPQLNHSESEKYLDLTENQIRAMTADDCMVASLLLAQLATHIQRLLNRENAILKFCDDEIWRAICDQVDEYRQVGQSFDERKYLTIKNNEYASKLSKYKLRATTRVEQLSYVAGRIDVQSDRLKSLSFSKRNSDG